MECGIMHAQIVDEIVPQHAIWNIRNKFKYISECIQWMNENDLIGFPIKGSKNSICWPKSSLD